MKVQIIESRRRSISLSVTEDGEVVARVPFGTKDSTVEKLVKEKKDWILKQLAKVEKANKQAKEAGILTEKELKALHDSAKKLIPQRVAIYAPKVGVSVQKITIRKQKTRWGSCSGKGNLNFNCLLMLAPLEVLDSVVVHELCHLKQMNHSKKFYDEVYRVYPEYDRCHAWLDQYGSVLQKRLGN